MPPLRSSGYMDPGWEHGVAQDERKKKVKCNYCGKVVSGGIYRLKQHLARISGEVTYCERAPDEVYLKMKENLEGCRSSKKPRPVDDDEQAYLNFNSHEDGDEYEIEKYGYRKKGKKAMVDENLVLNLTPLRSSGYVDPGWEYGVAQDERKKKVKCNYCGKIVSGGINRFKQHIARIPGEVAACRSAPEDVYLKIKENMKWHRTGRRRSRPEEDVNVRSSFYVYCDDEEEEYLQETDADLQMNEEKLKVVDKWSRKEFKRVSNGLSSGSGSEMQSKKSRLISDVLRATENHMLVPHKQASSRPNKKSQKEVFSAICEFFYYAGIPFEAADSLYFQKMLELVGQYGPGLVGPSSNLMSGQFLKDEISSIKEKLAECRASWVVTGCSIVADIWRNTQGRTLINFLASCPRSVHCISSMDVTDMIENPSHLSELLDKVVDEVGEEYVVQVITHDTPSLKAAGKMLEEKRRNLFWTPCVAYCIDRMLEDFMSIKLVDDCMGGSQKLTKFIYNRMWILNLMKKDFTSGQDLLRPAMTKYAASFATLQGVLEHKISLKRMFLTNKWLSSRHCRSDEGKEVEEIVRDNKFWKKMQYVHRSVNPILQVLQKVVIDGSLSMAWIYDDINRAKREIQRVNGDDVRRYGPFWSIIDSHWSLMLHHPLCVAAYFLNPAYQYRPDYVTNPEVMRGLNECIVKLEPDNGRRISASMQISDFVSAKADFGTELAVSTRAELIPAAWWQQHGINCLELQRIAIRIQSQTCSSFGHDHNWSAYDKISCPRQSNLMQKKLKELLYAHYNLRLKEDQLRRSSDLVSLDRSLLEGTLDDWIVGSEEQTVVQENEFSCLVQDILYNEDGCNYESVDYDDGNIGPVQDDEPLEMENLADIESLEVHPNNNNNINISAASDEDDELDFLEGDSE